MEKPNIHLFEVHGKFYFYDVNKNAIVEISKEAFDFLSSDESIQRGVGDEIFILKKEGLLSHIRPSCIEHPSTPHLEEILQSAVNRVCLQITQECNLRCKYCVYSGLYNNRTHSKSEMSIDIAKRAIDFLIDNSGNNEAIDIGFYGGEPLLRFPFIEKCIDYAKKEGEGKRLTFSITTNGTLITEKMIERFIESNVELTISIDGPETIHNRNRIMRNGEGSFKLLISKLDMINRRYPEYAKNISYNIVIDQREDDLDEIEKFISKSEIINNSFITATTISTEGTKEDIISCNAFRTKNRYGEFRYMLSLINRLSRDEPGLQLWQGAFKKLEQFAIDSTKNTRSLGKKEHHGGPCIPGQLRLLVNTNGDFLPCERVNEENEAMIIGNIEEGFDYKKISELLNIGKLTEEECKDCFAIRHCTICAASTDCNGKLSKDMKLRACEESRYNFSEMLKDLCVLYEAGYSPEK